MILTQSHTTANHQEACFQPTVFQCNFMIEACYDAPHFGEQYISVVGKHSQHCERYFSTVGNDSQRCERYFSVVGNDSHACERYFSPIGDDLQHCDRYFSVDDRHSPLFASKFIKTDINFQRYEPVNLLFNSKKKSYGNY